MSQQNRPSNLTQHPSWVRVPQMLPAPSHLSLPTMQQGYGPQNPTYSLDLAKVMVEMVPRSDNFHTTYVHIPIRDYINGLCRLHGFQSNHSVVIDYQTRSMGQASSQHFGQSYDSGLGESLSSMQQREVLMTDIYNTCVTGENFFREKAKALGPVLNQLRDRIGEKSKQSLQASVEKLTLKQGNKEGATDDAEGVNIASTESQVQPEPRGHMTTADSAEVTDATLSPEKKKTSADSESQTSPTLTTPEQDFSPNSKKFRGLLKFWEPNTEEKEMLQRGSRTSLDLPPVPSVSPITSQETKDEDLYAAGEDTMQTTLGKTSAPNVSPYGYVVLVLKIDLLLFSKNN